MRDPLRPRRLRRSLFVGFVLLVMAGSVFAGWYLHQRQEAQRARRQESPDVNGARPRGAGFSLLRPVPAKAEVNGEVKPPPPPPPFVPPVLPKKAAVAPKPTAPQKRERSKAINVVNTQPAPTVPKGPLYTLPIYTYIPAVLENVLVSEIEGMFTVKTTRPLYDATGTHVLIPQGTRIGAKSETADLLLGNERIPGWSLSAALPDGSALDLGNAPVMDATGTLGLRGTVNNRIWRLVWTSIFRGGLEGGQQVLQTQMGQTGIGPIASGIARQGNSATQQRLGRAQDNRPEITVASGQQVLILIPKALSLPAVGRR